MSYRLLLSGNRSAAFRRKVAVAVICCLALFGCGILSPAADTGASAATDTPLAAKNIILVIGDGMGFEHLRAASFLQEGDAEALSFHDLPYRAEAKTASASVFVTDSAAAATAIATGTKVYNGVISVALPGDGRSMETVLEYHAARGKATGLVTTASITHATPAAFAAHTDDRGNVEEVAADYFTETRPEVLFGGGGAGVSRQLAESKEYTVVTTSEELDAASGQGLVRVSGQFGNGHMPYLVDGRGDLPGLSAMTQSAVRILSNDPDGFFLMVEAARIDHASHDNDLERALYETIEMADTVAWLHEWALTAGETLLIVTADHETGGLTVQENRGAGELPGVTWASTGHTGANVPVFAFGPDGAGPAGTIDNTELYWLLR
jgi:alkaline phosphatase